MKFRPKICQLKTDNKIIIRIPEVKEAQDLLDLKRKYIQNTTSIPLTLAEYKNDAAKEGQLISQYNNSSNSILLVAVHNNKLIGNIDLTGSQRSKMKHTAMIGMGIMEEWRNQGLGKLLIEAVMDWAKNDTALKIIWLDVYASNTLGYNLYKNTGFEVSGTIKDFFKEKNGYKDKIQMFQRL